MRYKELLEKYSRFFDYIQHKQLKEAFDLLKDLVKLCKNKDLNDQMENLYQTYSNMLKYSFGMTDDPEKENVYHRLVKSLIELADDIKEDIVINHNLISYYRKKNEFERQVVTTFGESEELIENLEFSHEINTILRTGSVSSYEDSILLLFNHIWLSDNLKEAESDLLKKICKAGMLPWYDKSILVSALTLSVFRHFDSNKVMILLDFFENNENQVWQRALVGVILGLFYYDNRLKYYPEITNRLKSMQGNKDLVKNLETVIVQFIKAKETEKVTKKIREEILPEVLKMKSRLEEKLDLDNLLSAKSFEDKNPEWENFFKESPDIYNKFEEFSNMQIEGADVFLSAFAMLKRFDFFNEIANWFIPFYGENKIINQSLINLKDDLDINEFTEGLEKTTFMCNSDKYSFCLNVNFLPSEQKKMMAELFNMELKAMNEMAQDDSLINTNAQSKAIITQYFQDLYRFHKLHPLKEEFTDIFEMNFNIYQARFFQLLVDDKDILRNIAELFFEKNYFKEALDLFIGCSFNGDNYELFEKIAYCYQQTGDLQNALNYYLKAEMVEKDKFWILNKIAWCYRKLKNFNKALEYYREAEKIKPEEMQVQVMLGQTCMEMEDYESALNYFFKIEYSNPENHKIHRPLAWCSFVLGKPDTAKKYLEKIIAKEASKHDFLNLGHVEWALGNKQKAIENYKNGLKKSGNDFDWFTKGIEEDKKYLLKNGISLFDIPLMIDYLKIFEMH